MFTAFCDLDFKGTYYEGCEVNKRSMKSMLIIKNFIWLIFGPKANNTERAQSKEHNFFKLSNMKYIMNHINMITVLDLLDLAKKIKEEKKTI